MKGSSLSKQMRPGITKTGSLVGTSKRTTIHKTIQNNHRTHATKPLVSTMATASKSIFGKRTPVPTPKRFGSKWHAYKQNGKTIVTKDSWY